MDDISDIKHYYDETYDEVSRLSRHQLESSTLGAPRHLLYIGRK